MLLKGKELYEFGEFRLDVEEHTLTRSDGSKNGQLPEKAFQTLVILVRNSGHLLTKQQLIDQIWPDSFVEENNLDKCVHAIRHVLGEKPGEQKFIETVRKHGYRFVATVNKLETPRQEPASLLDSEFLTEPTTFKTHSQPTISTTTTESGAFVSAKWNLEDEGKIVQENGSHENQIVTDPRPDGSTENAVVSEERLEPIPPAKPPLFGKFRALAVYAGIAALLVGGVALYAAFTGPSAPILSAKYSAELLSTDGKVIQTAVSPDGKFVIYTHIEADETQSVWLRNLETGYNTEILSQSADFYYGLEFSPDGSLLYISRKPRNRDGQGDIYRVSIHGGIPQKIIGETQGWISISPDGSQIAFVRCPYLPDDNCSLWTADSSDGRNERKLLTRPQPYRLSDIDFSPDGTLIAFASGQSENQGMDFALSAFDLSNGTERELTPERFFNITGLGWLPNQNSMLITASKRPTEIARIWHVAIDTGKAEPVTKDSESYLALSIDRSGSSLVAKKYDQNFRIRIMNWENASESLVLPKAGRMSFAPDGRLFFSSVVSGNSEIWSVNPDGSGRRQLTDDPGDDLLPVVGPDNTSVYFASNRTGSIHVWRMNADGSRQTQLTRETGGFPISASPDGEWVYFYHGLNRSLWRVSVRGGEEQMVLSKERRKFAISPDGTHAAYGEYIDGEKFVVIVSLPNGDKIDRLKIADQTGKLIQLAWLADGKGVAYILAKDEFQRNTVWLHTFDARETPRKIVEIDQQIGEGNGFAVAPDGKSFAVSQGDWLNDAVLIKGLK